MAGEEDPSVSLVVYTRDHSGYRCGYCKSQNSNFSHGMWAHELTVGDYQTLIDRGWRRSGQYCYKPTMDVVCCPPYTIRCDATQVQLTKSQKKVLKRMHRYLSHGTTKEQDSSSEQQSNNIDLDGGGHSGAYVQPGFEVKKDLAEITLSASKLGERIAAASSEISHGTATATDGSSSGNKGVCTPEEEPEDTGDGQISSREGKKRTAAQNQLSKQPAKAPRAGVGRDPNRPPCKKAKQLRRERYEARHDGDVSSKAAKKHKGGGSDPKEIEDFLNEPMSDQPAHKLEVRLVRSSMESLRGQGTFDTEYQVYLKYQVSVHRDPPAKVSPVQFTRFLCNSPLKSWKPRHCPVRSFGSFHHQYWLDGKLIAVGVLDILPLCVSSVYFFYDPDYAFLSLGTYASLREIALARELQKSLPELKWYYMGYYIHSCPKMRYKGQYHPSDLLCPTSYTWNPIEKCKPKLDVSKFSTLTDDPDATDEDGKVNLDRVLILHDQEPMWYNDYKMLGSSYDEEEVKEYAHLVGSKMASRILLYRE
ncbi:arginyltransferase 1 isoform X2 [Oratosquilla oratoria]|uniref:arginyltransferase 1 isoform X2 n=1 Tax=Oratosquilla oratoria TaxID=337810 RepID=UPI003F75A9B6